MFASNDDLMSLTALRDRLGDRVRIGDRCRIHSDVTLEVAPTGRLTIGDDTSIRRGTSIEVGPGATAVIGRNVTIGENVFVYVMCGFFMGDGSALSNMVDIHDHNHRPRTAENLATGALTTYDSGFTAAPIVIEPGALVSNKCTVLAGVRVGANSIVGANSAVSKSLPPNTVSVGSPARPVRTFNGVLPNQRDPQLVKVLLVGTSIMEHYEAESSRMRQQSSLPVAGEKVTVERWAHKGYPDMLLRRLRIAHPHADWQSTNWSKGGATSRDLLSIVQGQEPGEFFDLCIFGCGINDVWRCFQNRTAEMVDITEYAENIREVLNVVIGMSSTVLLVGETPFEATFAESADMNADLGRYMMAAQDIARSYGIRFVDTIEPFKSTENLFATYSQSSGLSLWSDGVHLSDLGDELVAQTIINDGERTGLFADLFTYKAFEKKVAARTYGSLVNSWVTDLDPTR